MGKQKKVLQINAYYATGSTGNIVRDIEKKCLNSGLDMYAIYWLLPNKENENFNVYYCGRYEKKSWISKIANWIFAGGKLAYNSDVTENIISKIRDIDPDIIHLHNLHGDFEYGMIDIPMLFEFLAKINKEIIWTFHDCWPITGRCYHFEYKKCDKWRTGCGNCPQKLYDREGIFIDRSRQNWIKKKELYSKLNNLTIVTVSRWLENVVNESMLGNNRCLTIYNGIDADAFRIIKKDEKHDKFRILCIGWDRRKGYKDYYKLSKLLKSDEEIVVVGRRPVFRKFKRIPDNIREIDRASSKEEMASIYKQADIYFNASLAETFGLTTIEAFSSGLPVVGYNCTATPEIINFFNNGICADRGDVELAYQALLKLKNIGKSTDGNKKCREKFSIEKMVSNYFQLYMNALPNDKEIID